MKQVNYTNNLNLLFLEMKKEEISNKFEQKETLYLEE